MKHLARATLVSLLALCRTAPAERFYADDPVWREPAPRTVGEVKTQKLNPLVDFYKNTIYDKGQRNSAAKVYTSIGVNTLGEVPDSTWFTNRHDRTHRLSEDALLHGPNVTGPPDTSKPWVIVSAKAEGVTPGFAIRDAKGHEYFLKFDPPDNPEMATAADVICARFLYAVGYNVPENYIVTFRPEQLEIKPGLQFEDPYGRFRSMQPQDVYDLLNLVAHHRSNNIRAVASLRIPGKGVGNFKYYKRRADDPNEIGPHEHLRVLRGLYVFAAWLNQTDAKALNTYDSVVEEDGRKFIKHYLLDFGSALGSDAIAPKDPRLGHEYFIDFRPGLRNLLGFGFYVPKYARVDFHTVPAVGKFEAEAFEPDKWKPNYPNAAFICRLPGDEYWGTRKLLAFTDQDIRNVVRTARYSDPQAEDQMARILIERRNKIGQAFLKKVLPLENVRIANEQIEFEDLAAVLGYREPTPCTITWHSFDNSAGKLQESAVAEGRALPAEIAALPSGSYAAAIIRSNTLNQSVTVYFRRTESWEPVGLEREGENRWEPTE